MPVANGVEKAFPGAGTKPGVEVWRIEFFKPVKVDPKQHGKFHKGDSYIVLQTIAVGSKANIFFWLGPETSQDEAGAAAQLAVTLDDELGGFPVQHREVGRYEDEAFKALFPKMSLLDGGHASGFKEGKKKFKKALLQVKGKRKVYASQVSLDVSSLNQGDCFVLDSGRKIFVWIGKESNLKERINALSYARELRDEERAGLARVQIVESPEDEEEFFYALTGNKRVVQITKEGESDQQIDETVNLTLYRVKEDETGNITMKETGGKPLSRKDLDSDDVFILETGVSVYVWIGHKASRKEKSKAIKDAQGFLSARQLNPNTSYKIIKDELEPTEFKQYFTEWEGEIDGQTYQAGRGIATKEQIEKKFGKFEVKSMHNNRKTSVSSSSGNPDDGSGSKQVWRVKSFELVPVPEESHGVFYSGDCYVVLYTYLKNTKEYHIVYFWLGNDSTSDEQGAAAAAAVQLDDKFNGEPIQIRVCEGKEPDHFFSIFNRQLLIYQGGHASGFRNVQQSGSAGDTRLLQVRVVGNDARIVEVLPVAQSLNSSDVFVLHNPHACFIWVGKGSIGDEQHCAKEVLKRISISEYDLLLEGKDEKPKDKWETFWQMLGGKADYGSAKQSWGEVESTVYAARLFHCSDASGRFVVEEVLNFSQEDLEEDDVMILDAWTQVFIWVGSKARKEEKREAIRTAVEYVKTDPRQRSPNKLIMLVIKQGAEPLAFKSYFVAWEPQMWKKKMTYEDQLKAIKQGNENVDEDAWTMTEWNEALKPKEYAIDVLRKKGEELPEDVDPTKKEMHLADDSFVELFKMTKKEWEGVPQWKKNQTKKALDLF